MDGERGLGIHTGAVGEIRGTGAGFQQAGTLRDKTDECLTPVRPYIDSKSEGNLQGKGGPHELECLGEEKEQQGEEASQEVGGQEQEEAEEPEEEGRVPRAALDPRQPTKAEIAEHNLTHVPFRSWCKYCIWGKNMR